MKGAIGGRLYNSIDWEEGCFLQNYGDCVMLNESGLCDLQLEAGEDALCDTCTLYPRHMEEFEGVREWSLSLSCPEAARLITEYTEKIEFTDWETDGEEAYEEFDYFLYSILLRAREVLYIIIQNREIPFYEKAAILTNIGHKLQECINHDNLSGMEDVLQKISEDRDYGYLDKRLFAKLFELENLDNNWLHIINETYEAWTDEIVQLTNREEIIAEQLLMFFVYTYFCGAVYDDMILSKVMLAVCSVYWIFRIYQNHSFDLGIAEAAYRYAREIEHSDINLDELENWFDI